MAAPPSAERSPGWYVQAAGRVWGPYSPTRIQAFLAERRVTGSTLVADRPDGPFAPAERHPGFSQVFQPQAPRREAPVAGPARALVVWTELKSLSPQAFEGLLSGVGPVVAIRPGLWLVRSRHGATALRNALSRRLRGDDALLVLETPLEKAAWFNLDGAGRELRHLWAGAGEEA